MGFTDFGGFVALVNFAKKVPLIRDKTISTLYPPIEI